VVHLHRTVPEIIEAAVARMSSALAPLLDATERDMQALEADVSAAVNALGREVMAAMLAKRDVTPDGWWCAVRANGTYTTVFGAVEVERGLYRERRNGLTRCVVEEAAGIIEGMWTPLAAKRALELVTEMTPGNAEKLLEGWGGMSPSRSSLDRLPKRLSEVWEGQLPMFEAELRNCLEIPTGAAVVAVSLDGVLAPMRGTRKAQKKAATRANHQADKGPAGYKEVGCGAITFYDADGERLSTWRYGRMPEPDKATLKATLRAELDAVVNARPDLVVVAIADGSPNNWTFLEGLDADYEIVDFYHAVEHLGRALDIGLGAVTPEREAAFRELRRTLRDDPAGAKLVLAQLVARVAKKRPKHHRRGVPYFQRHLSRMDYAAYQAANLPIGSGVMEGTCRSLVSDRLKLTGMRWSAEGGQGILTWRAHRHSGRFDAAWELLRPSLARRPQRAAA
jgi:hypothetical protein